MKIKLQRGMAQECVQQNASSVSCACFVRWMGEWRSEWSLRTAYGICISWTSLQNIF